MTGHLRRFRPLVCALLIPCALSGQDAAERWNLITLVKHHQGLKRDLRVQDVYKMICENSLWPAFSDTSSVRSELHEEFLTMDTASRGETLVERISLDGEIVRVNLRPFKALNLNPDLLVEVVFRSARETTPDTLMFHRQWNEFVALVEYGLLDFPREDVASWNGQVSAGTISTVPHSEEYTTVNRSAYRVVRRSVFEAAVPQTK